MKTIMKEAIRGQKGAAVLSLVLILLVLGGLILGPLLGLMSTGLVAGQVYEKKTDELYAADAGVEDAIWRIQTNNLTFDADNRAYTGPVSVNDRSVDVVIYRQDLDPTPCGENFTYQILSTARSPDGSGTKIDAHIATTIEYYPGIMDQLITIQASADPKEVEGDLKQLNMACSEACTQWGVCGKAYDYSDYGNIPEACKGYVAVYSYPIAAWPTLAALSAWYWKDVKNQPQYGSTIVDLKNGDQQLGPGCYNGTLQILNKNNKEVRTLTLNGTLYVTGDTEIGMSGGGTDKPNLTIQLKGNTIFVASNSSDPQKALQVGAWCSINGPGVIVVVGDINFKPNGYVGANAQPAFVLSVSGTTTIQNGADFLGAIAGKLDVEVESGGKAEVDYPIGGFGQYNLNFPARVEDEASRTYTIASWEISAL